MSVLATGTATDIGRLATGTFGQRWAGLRSEARLWMGY